MLADALVHALVATAQQGEPIAAGKLVRNRVVELTPRGRQHHDPARGQHRAGVGPVHGLQRRVDDVDPDQHPRTASVWSVVDLPVRERRRVAVVEQAQVVTESQRVSHVPL